MASKDETHSGFAPAGAKPPLRRSWREATSSTGDSFVAWPVVVDGIAMAKFDSGLIAVEASSGRRVWFRDFAEGHSIGVPAVEGESVFAPLYDGVLVALDLADGRELWRFKADDELEASPTVSGGRIFVNSARAKTTHCISAVDGSSCWTRKLDLEPDTVPAVSQGVVAVVAQSLDEPRIEIYGLSAEDGSILWSKPHARGYSSASILDNKVILGGGDFNAHALDLTTGESIWKSPVKGKFGPRNLPALAFGDVFLADRTGNIYRLDGDTGKQKWIYEVPDEGTFDQSFPVIAGKTLFIGSGSGWIYALHTETGRLLWKEQVGGFVLSGAADSERFYFGVKFRNEGLYAYEHDPNGRLEPPPSEPTQQIIAGVLLFAILVGGVWLYGRRRRSADEGP
ncbi:MAG TPA: PQQ-binding-like beta-propeller repeat protein [Actinomycetota bacterium]|nr:PQQ-binding-like beta-propeller repeat protein [Actinomycetota bacterium]